MPFAPTAHPTETDILFNYVDLLIICMKYKFMMSTVRVGWLPFSPDADTVDGKGDRCAQQTKPKIPATQPMINLSKMNQK
ncbi:MAG: hypothetical protein Fur0025_39540 [Oscillatoriaceae cyanobacterium]